MWCWKLNKSNKKNYLLNIEHWAHEFAWVGGAQISEIRIQSLPFCQIQLLKAKRKVNVIGCSLFIFYEMSAISACQSCHQANVNLYKWNEICKLFRQSSKQHHTFFISIGLISRWNFSFLFSLCCGPILLSSIILGHSQLPLKTFTQKTLLIRRLTQRVPVSQQMLFVC